MNTTPLLLIMKLVIALLYLICSAAAFFFIIRLLCAPFSSKVREQIRKYPVIHWIWGFVAFPGLLVFLGVLSWPPLTIERRAQRAALIERVQAAGGWEAIRQGCVVLAEQNTNGFSSGWRDTNGLPAALAVLNPMLVKYKPQHGSVSIRIFGIHSTGGRSTPYFGLEVDTSTNSISYMHGMGYDNSGVKGHSSHHQVAQGIYEIY